MNSRISRNVGRLVFQNSMKFSRTMTRPFKPVAMAPTTAGAIRTMSSSVSDKFAEAQANLTQVTDRSNDVRLKLYGLHKQATEGKNTTQKRPLKGMMDFLSHAKWEAWNSLGDISQEEAQKQYIKLVESLLASSAAQNSPKSSSEGSGLTVEVRDGVRTIKLNRPAKKNALTVEMYDGIGKALREANLDNSTKIVVLTGTGDYFCSGNDLAFFANATDVKKTAKDGRSRLLTYVAAYINCQKPIIALINGPAVGIAVTVLGLVDLAFCTDKAHFSTPLTALGQSPEACSSYTFPRTMGYSKASDFLYFGSQLTAQQAQECGLITEVFPQNTFEAETSKRTQAWAKLPLKSLIYTKELVRGRERKLLHEVNTAEAARLEERWQSEDCMNAIMKSFSKHKK